MPRTAWSGVLPLLPRPLPWASFLVLGLLAGGAAAADPPAPADPVPARPPDGFTRAVQRAVVLHGEGDDAAARRALMDAVDEARLRAPLEVHTGVVLAEPPQTLGMYKAAPGAMAQGRTLLLYAEVDNHSFRKRPEGYEIDLWTDVFILYEDGERIGGKEHFGVHKLVSQVPHRTTFMFLEVNTSALPPDPYQVEITVHDAVSGKKGSLRIPFRVAARPGMLP